MLSQTGFEVIALADIDANESRVKIVLVTAAVDISVLHPHVA